MVSVNQFNIIESAKPLEEINQYQNYGDDEVMNKWMQVNKAREGEIQEKLNKNYDEVDENPIQIISYLDVWMHFSTENFSDVIDDIVRETNSSGGLKAMFTSKTKLDKSLHLDRDIFM